ncbi:MAG: family 10 glycosylhydrolase [Candidatus Brocadiae bacterium]|nr:family 10 glycosylhydrolase [Candidatus Brocadiia bacterium]
MRIGLFILLFSFCIAFSQDYDPSKENFQSYPLSAPVWLPANRTMALDQGAEWRGFWADAWNKGFLNKSQIKEMVAIAKQYGYNAILIQARRRGDAIYFPSFPNTEPRMNGLAQDFDALREAIQEARSQGLELHAWVSTFLVAPPTVPTNPEHVYLKHPEYLNQTREGQTKFEEGYFLDPGHPEALQWNERVIMDLITHYDIDGLHFDYVRYPQQNAGYNPISIARYNQEYGLTGKPLANDPQFSEWRRRQITDWVRYMYVKILERKPLMKVTAATFAGRSDAYTHRLQDWALWMKEGILDANLPMNYSQNLSIFQNRVKDVLENSYGRHVYMGTGAYLLPVEDNITQLQYARDSGSFGLVLFSYANNAKGGVWLENFQKIQQKLFFQSARVPEMPWKTNPTNGYLYGKVVSINGSALDHARIFISSYQKQTNGEGAYSFVGLLPGEYAVRCEMLGWKAQARKVSIAKGHVSLLNFSMEKEQ